MPVPIPKRIPRTAWLAVTALTAFTACRSPLVSPEQRRAASTKWAAELAAFDARDTAHPPAPGATLFVGSSSFRLWHDLPQAFPDRHVINRGFGGSQMHELLALADRLVWRYAPREIIVYEGDNDIAAGKSPEQFFLEFKTFVRETHRRLPHAHIYFVSIKPSPARQHLWPLAQRANQMVQNLATNDPQLTYIDVATPMLDPQGRPRPELFVSDRLHLNRHGYALWADRIRRALERHGNRKPQNPN